MPIPLWKVVLSAHEITDAVVAIVARDSVLQHKPHPRPLHLCFERFSVEPGNAFFIGDDRSDAETGAETGSNFPYRD